MITYIAHFKLILLSNKINLEYPHIYVFKDKIQI